MVVLSAVFLFPFFWMFLTTVQSTTELFAFPPVWFPATWHWSNYAKTLQSIPFGQYTLNSLVIAVCSVAGVFFSCSLAAFGLVRYDFRGKEVVFAAILASMIIPINAIIIPQYLIFRQLHWLDTFLPLIVPTFFGYSMGTFLLRQFFSTIPKELDEAATIDGAGGLRILLSVFTPLSTGAFITLGLFIFVFQWNDLLRPIIFLTSSDRLTLPVGIVNMMGEYSVQWNLLMCASLLSVLPVLIVFLVAQRHYIQGIAMQALKG